jgi:MoxR-like ATPase
VPSLSGKETVVGELSGDLSSDALWSVIDAVVDNVCSVLYGKERSVRLALACLVAGGHLLVEDLPGVGKTTMAKALARSLGLGFRRVQCTADLLPSDITGALVFDREQGTPVFRPGPVFTNVLVADELNRASARAQSALLEAMEEHQVSVDGTTHRLPRPFMVLATQNPYDTVGTHRLPHGQQDRFMLCMSVGYPDRAAEDALLTRRAPQPSLDELDAVCDAATLRALTALVDQVHAGAALRGYILDLVAATRSHPELAVGASPRAALSVLRVAAATALFAHRDFVTPEDVKAVAVPALAHRVVVDAAAELSGADAGQIIEEIVERLPVPVRRRVATAR